MRKANIEYIEARTQFAYPLRDYRPVLFGLYASGTFRHGEIKGVYYLPYYQGQLTDDLDKYNRALIKPDKEPPNGTWYRKLDDNWYLAYMAD